MISVTYRDISAISANLRHQSFQTLSYMISAISAALIGPFHDPQTDHFCLGVEHFRDDHFGMKPVVELGFCDLFRHAELALHPGHEIAVTAVRGGAEWAAFTPAIVECLDGGKALRLGHLGSLLGCPVTRVVSVHEQAVVAAQVCVDVPVVLIVRLDDGAVDYALWPVLDVRFDADALGIVVSGTPQRVGCARAVDQGCGSTDSLARTVGAGDREGALLCACDGRR
jgi:hypothetical protein